MKKLVLLSLILGFYSYSLLNGQTGSVVIENVHISTRDKKVIINYDLNCGTISDTLSHNIKLNFITKASTIETPQSISGDVGDNISCGKGKSVVWNVSEDMDILDEDLKPYLIVDRDLTTDLIRGGSDNAFFSMLIPGLGDYFVSPGKEIKFKPYLRTASVAALIGTGIYAKRNRYTDISHTTVLRREGSYSTGYTLVEETVDLTGDTHYKFFRHDAEIFYTLGAALWIYDVFWVWTKGYQNGLMKKSINDSTVELSLAPGGLSFVCTF
jgi:hypothetical protein